MQVLEWISYHVEKNKYDASSIDFSCCNMDGHTLCHCSRDQMRLIFGPLGDELYDRLHEISECSKVSFFCRPGSLKNEFESPVLAQDPLLPLQRLCGRVWGHRPESRHGWAQLPVCTIPLHMEQALLIPLLHLCSL